YPMFGWAMTESPKCMNTSDLTAYKVFIDGVSEPVNSSNFVAGLTRSDLPVTFPGLCNSNDALAAYYFNASALGLTNGVHTVMWQIRDDGGNVTNIGSRYFTLLASSGQRVPQTQAGGAIGAARVRLGAASALAPPSTGATLTASVNGAPAVTVTPGLDGMSHVQMPALGLLSVDLGGPVERGYEVVGDELRALPIGSTLDAAQGRFSWQPGVGFFGPFHLVFVSGAARTDLEVTIVDPTTSDDVRLQVDTPQLNATLSGAFT